MREITRFAPSSSALLAVVLISMSNPVLAEQGASPRQSANASYAAWKNGPPSSADYFPIAVWLQDPKNAGKYKSIGVNLYIALWQGPNQQQIDELKKHDMPVICEQNAYARMHLQEKTIVGWMHGDEPDNAQPLKNEKGYGPPIPPKTIVDDYDKIRANDPTRPVMLNLGQGVAWDGWYGRGVRTNHPEDYPEYIRGGDIISFDIYPVVHDRPAVAGKLWYVPRGVDRLRGWTQGSKIVWNCIECTRIGNTKIKPTPAQVKAEVWMSIIHGSRGLIYFCHQFEPQFVEAALLADQEMARAVGAINREIHLLAAVINSPSITDALTVQSDPSQVSAEQAKVFPGSTPIATMVKKHDGQTYIFAVCMEDKPTKAQFQVNDLSGSRTVEVIGQPRTVRAENGRFADQFAPYAVHLYKIP